MREWGLQLTFNLRSDPKADPKAPNKPPKGEKAECHPFRPLFRPG